MTKIDSDRSVVLDLQLQSVRSGCVFNLLELLHLSDHILLLKVNRRVVLHLSQQHSDLLLSRL